RASRHRHGKAHRLLGRRSRIADASGLDEGVGPLTPKRDGVGVLDTARLKLRAAVPRDATFILRLLNEPSFLEFIGDRKVRTIADAERYIHERLIASYERNGFGLWIVERREAVGPIGICGLVKRDSLPDVDIGFAFLPEFWRRGYAFESAAG